MAQGSRYKDETVVRTAYLYNENSYTGDLTSLHSDGTLVSVVKSVFALHSAWLSWVQSVFEKFADPDNVLDKERFAKAITRMSPSQVSLTFRLLDNHLYWNDSVLIMIEIQR